jgi:hypothetical protein
MHDGTLRGSREEGWMRATVIALAFATLSGPSSAYAQDQSLRQVDPAAAQALREACRIDYRAHCTGEKPALAIETACLAQYYVNLSKGCQSALDNLRSDTGGGETDSSQDSQ